jgi:Fn3 associated
MTKLCGVLIFHFLSLLTGVVRKVRLEGCAKDAGNALKGIESRRTRTRAISKCGKFFCRYTPALRYKQFLMQKITLSSAALAAIIAMTIPQACVGTARTIGTVGTAATQCAQPTLTPSDATHAAMLVTVRIATKTAGAYLRYTLDGSTPTGGVSGNGTEIAAASGKISFNVTTREKALKAIAYKPGLADSPIAEATYVYQSPY